MENILGVAAMLAITFPVSYLLAKQCLRGVVHIVTGGETRDVL
jgi:hypothetical protein